MFRRFLNDHLRDLVRLFAVMLLVGERRQAFLVRSAGPVIDVNVGIHPTALQAHYQLAIDRAFSTDAGEMKQEAVIAQDLPRSPASSRGLPAVRTRAGTQRENRTRLAAHHFIQTCPIVARPVASLSSISTARSLMTRSAPARIISIAVAPSSTEP